MAKQTAAAENAVEVKHCALFESGGNVPAVTLIVRSGRLHQIVADFSYVAVTYFSGADLVVNVVIRAEPELFQMVFHLAVSPSYLDQAP